MPPPSCAESQLLVQTGTERPKMRGKRKRSHKSCITTDASSKRAKVSTDCTATIQHPLLSAYYPTVLTLRGYVILCLPFSSKARRRKISGLGNHPQIVPLSQSGSFPIQMPSSAANAQKETECEMESLLANLLDTTLVGVLRQRKGEMDQSRMRDFVTFSQQVSPTATSSLGDGLSSQSEVSCTLVAELSACLHEAWSCLHL